MVHGAVMFLSYLWFRIKSLIIHDYSVLLRVLLKILLISAQGKVGSDRDEGNQRFASLHSRPQVPGILNEFITLTYDDEHETRCR